jgi:hypothetical protein
VARRYVAVALLSTALTGCSPQGSETLPKLGIDIDKTSVSGLSAGAYMAGQLQVAHSNSVIGAGIVAGGPYGCAEAGIDGAIPSTAANVVRALEGCMSDKLLSQGIPSVDALVERAQKLAAASKKMMRSKDWLRTRYISSRAVLIGSWHRQWCKPHENFTFVQVYPGRILS